MNTKPRKHKSPPLSTNRAAVQRIASYKFLGVLITEDLTPSVHSGPVIATANSCFTASEFRDSIRAHPY